MTTAPTEQQVQQCRDLLDDDGAGLVAALHPVTGGRIYRGPATSGRDLSCGCIRNILCAAVQTRGAVGDIAAALERLGSPDCEKAEAGLRELQQAATRGDRDAFVARLEELGLDVYIDMDNLAWRDPASWAKPLLVFLGHCPKWQEPMFAHPHSDLLTSKFVRAAAKSFSPSGTFMGGLNTNQTCARYVSGDSFCNCVPHKHMPAGSRAVSKQVVEATYDLLLACFPVAKVVVLQFGDVADQGVARSRVVSTKEGRLLRYAAHHVSCAPKSLQAAVTNFAGVSLLHAAAADPAVTSLDDLPDGGADRALVAGVRALIGARDFKAPKKAEDRATLEANVGLLEDAVGKGQEAVGGAYDRIGRRLGWGTFTDQNRSDGGTIGGAAATVVTRL